MGVGVEGVKGSRAHNYWQQMELYRGLGINPGGPPDRESTAA